MSRQAPIYISDSEEEPMEESFVPESPSVHEGATSDDTYVPPPTTTTTDPTTHMLGSTFMATRHMTAGPSRGPVLRRTPVSCVRDFPTGPLDSRGKAPMIDTEEPPQGQFPHLDWMPGMLRYWRALEDIPSTLEIGEPSRRVPITGEPLELTAITLVALVRALFGLHYGTRSYIRELRSDTSRLDGDVTSIYGRLSTVETHVDVDRESADATRARVGVLERRARVFGIVLGVCLMLAVAVTAVMFCLSYFQ